ncbi:nuclease [Pseudoalteromonas lipolytica SCSIO 04301]|uniref:nuclease-related domain-containing protein n=1 Tax=Pseudoalteromonas TaxID=53246 RepID=UPI0004497F05|nr:MULTISPECIES: nuclease-related domain-containing protein [Pseudoalteromonas]EWH05513.1 nuclease [Pseudoalteromonas lipolytica SCSIO 04301]MCC9660398.1 NERD domain-containing protein [Pseudoalteromonas sp. MB41]QMW16724.1 NERD domain-containing protein [Pseudoalteromonas sp. MT33b]
MENFLNQGLSLLFVIIGAYSILGVIFFKLWIHQKNAKLPIERKKLLRLAAQTLNDQVNDKIFDVVGYIFLAVFIITMPFALKGIAEMFASGQLNYFFIIFIAIGLIYTARKLWLESDKLIKLKLGRDAELAVAAELIELQSHGYQIFHDIQADGFNIDHLVIGSNGVFAIETKGRHKRIKDDINYKVRFENNLLAFPSWNESKPIEQAEIQSQWVYKWLNEATGFQTQVTPILCFPGWFVELKQRPPFPIVSHKQLAKAILSMRKCQLNEVMQKAICYQVIQRCAYSSKA